MAVTVELRDQAAPRIGAAGTDVRAIFGRAPALLDEYLRFVRDRVVASATCYAGPDRRCWNRVAETAPLRLTICVYPDTVVHSVIPLGGGEVIGTFVSPGRRDAKSPRAAFSSNKSRRDSYSSTLRWC